VKRRRFLVLHLPHLATDRIRQKEPDLAGIPVATWDTQGNRRLLMGVDAPGTTLHAGQALADAQAMHPELALRPAEPDADIAFLERLALWAVRFTPISAVDPPDGLVLDVTGCSDLFGGEAALLARISNGFQHGGVAAQAVVAAVADAAAALAREQQLLQREFRMLGEIAFQILAEAPGLGSISSALSFGRFTLSCAKATISSWPTCWRPIFRSS
jgi:protein ImuB